jgi:hypothetical protein
LAVRLADLLDQFNNPFEKQVATELLRLSTQAGKDEALLRQCEAALAYYHSEEDYYPTPASEALAALRGRLKEET